MKGAILTRYGGPEDVKLADLDAPEPGPKEALIDVKASSINSWDWEIVRGTPIYNRLVSGMMRPIKNRLGFDVAGTVTTIGEGVTTLAPGDRVFGDLSMGSWGAFAEQAVGKEVELARIPDKMTYEEAAALPQAGIMALMGVRLAGDLAPGSHALISGAGGGVGTIAIPLLKQRGAEVTAIDASHKLDRLTDLGADHVFDYRETDFTSTGQKYDFILDMVATRPLFAYWRALQPGGKFGVIGGKTTRLLEYAALSRPLMAFSDKTFSFVWNDPATANLDALAKLTVDKTIAPVIDRTFTLDEIADAFRYFAENRFFGKVVITV